MSGQQRTDGPATTRGAAVFAASPIMALLLVVPAFEPLPSGQHPNPSALIDSMTPVPVPVPVPRPEPSRSPAQQEPVVSPAQKEATGRAREGVTAYGQGDYDRAIADYTEAIRLDPRRASFFNNRAAARLAKKDGAGALADYQEAIRLDPSSASAHYGLGLVHQGRHEYDQALAGFSEAIRLAPKLAGAYNNRGLVWHDKRDYERAIADFNEAIRLNPEDAVVYNNRGNTREAEGNLDRALKDYTEALQLDPDYVKAYNNRARLRETRGDFAGALADYSEATRLDPQGSRGYRGRARILATSPDAAMRDGKAAVADATRACELNDWKDPEALATLAAAEAEAGNFPAAVSWQTKALERLSPQNPLRALYQSRLKLYQSNKPFHEPATNPSSARPRRSQRASWRR